MYGRASSGNYWRHSVSIKRQSIIGSQDLTVAVRIPPFRLFTGPPSAVDGIRYDLMETTALQRQPLRGLPNHNPNSIECKRCLSVFSSGLWSYSSHWPTEASFLKLLQSSLMLLLPLYFTASSCSAFFPTCWKRSLTSFLDSWMMIQSFVFLLRHC